MTTRIYGRHNSHDLKVSRIGSAGRLLFLRSFFLSLCIIIIVRLFFLMIVQHGFYVALAQGTQEIYSKLIPERGKIFAQDSRTGKEYPLAMNSDYFVVYADTRDIENDEQAEDVAEKISAVFGYDNDKKFQLFLKVNKRNDPYEPIEQKVPHETADKIRDMDIPGIGLVRRSYRYYPEGKAGSHVVGFLGKDDSGETDIGRYGVEGYWNRELAGSGGFLEGVRSAGGGWISLAGKSFKPAEDGADIVLTIDRTLQYTACEKLRADMEEYGAQSASLIIMDPHTGAVRAMCSFPDFDPNDYGKVDSIDVYNNSSIFTPYEPGSIFKPVIMSSALNEGVVDADTIFYDSGSKSGLCQKPIRNADGKVYQNQNMSGILENSINTGMVFVAEQLGKQKEREYIEKFGFGLKEGIELDTERTGTIDSLSLNNDNSLDCYGATASFGQGITVTPLQMVSAFSVFANGGMLLKPYIVDEIRYPDGRIQKTATTPVRQVLDARATRLISAMLVNVVDSGHASRSRVYGYYVAGKTGTAQIAGEGGYTDETNHSFVGFAPVDNPVFVMIVKFEKPRRVFSASTAAPTFGKIADFTLKYYGIPPER